MEKTEKQGQVSKGIAVSFASALGNTVNEVRQNLRPGAAWPEPPAITALRVEAPQPRTHSTEPPEPRTPSAQPPEPPAPPEPPKPKVPKPTRLDTNPLAGVRWSEQSKLSEPIKELKRLYNIVTKRPYEML
jgi:hypothetical protein